jgi:hypothetical protein
LLVSLHSVFVGCADNGCFIKHSQATNGYLSLDLDRGEMFCVGCNDYVYDSAVEEVRTSVLREIEVSNNVMNRVTGHTRGLFLLIFL